MERGRQIGTRFYWTKEREKALIILGNSAIVKGKKRKNWKLASKKSPLARSILKDKSNNYLSIVYKKIKKSHEGMCMYTNCNQIITDGGRYCIIHRSRRSRRDLLISIFTIFRFSNIKKVS